MGGDGERDRQTERCDGSMQTQRERAHRIARTQILIYPQEGVRAKKTLITDEYLRESLSLVSPRELISDI